LNINLTEKQRKFFENLTDDQKEFFNKIQNHLNSDDPSDRVSVKEVLTTDNARILLPTVIQMAVQEAAEPEYLVSRFLQRVNITAGSSVEIPIVSVLKAGPVPEAGEYPEEELNWVTAGNATNLVKVQKYGVRTRITRELIEDSLWDVIGMHIRAAGRAMARLLEEIVFNEWSKHGHNVFDNDLRGKDPRCGTTGLDYGGAFNDTLSTMDFVFMSCVLIMNGFRPTDIIMHPLCIPLFYENQFIKAYTGGIFAGGPKPNPDGYIKDPNATNGPPLGGINVIYSPFVPFNAATMKFDLYMIDRNEVGVLLVREDLRTDQFEDPARDLVNLKVMARWGVGTLNEGRAIAVARNIAFARSYEAPDRIYTLQMGQDVIARMNALMDATVL
jgi:hypothetical protein